MLEISWSSLWRVFIFLLFVTILLLGRNIVLGLFLAIVLSSGIEFLIEFFRKRGVPRTLAVFLIFAFTALVIAVVIYLLVPYVISDLSLVLENFEESPLSIWLSPLLDLQTSQSLSSWANRISGELLSGRILPLGAVSGVLNGIGLGVAILVITFYLSLSPNGVEKFLRAIVPEEKEELILNLYSRSIEKISFWFRTQLILSFMVGALVWASLFLLGVRHSLLLGLLAGVFEIVPFVGPILSGAAAVLFAFVTSPSLAFYTLIIFIAIQQFESNVLVPLVTRRTVGLHPVVVIIAFLIGLEVGGFLGVLVAVPAAAVFQEIVEDRSSRKIMRASLKNAE